MSPTRLQQVTLPTGMAARLIVPSLIVPVHSIILRKDVGNELGLRDADDGKAHATFFLSDLALDHPTMSEFDTSLKFGARYTL
jgi:hypothetical protein